MSQKHEYLVSFFTVPFKSLEDAKWNVKVSFTRHEAIKYLRHTDEEIFHFIGDKLHSKTPIKVDESGNISFGKTYKVISKCVINRCI